MPLHQWSNVFACAVTLFAFTFIPGKVCAQGGLSRKEAMDMFKFLVTGHQVTLAKIKEGEGNVAVLNRWFGEKGAWYRLNDGAMTALEKRLPAELIARLKPLKGVRFTDGDEFRIRVGELVGSDQFSRHGQAILTCALGDSVVREEQADMYCAFKGNKRRWDVTSHRMEGDELARKLSPLVGEVRRAVDGEKALKYDLRADAPTGVHIVSARDYPSTAAATVRNFHLLYYLTFRGYTLSELFAYYKELDPSRVKITVEPQAGDSGKSYKALFEHRFIGQERVNEGLFSDAFWIAPENGFFLVAYETWNLGWLNYRCTIHPKQYPDDVWFFDRVEAWEYTKGGVPRFQQMVTVKDFQFNQGIPDSVFTFEGMGVKRNTTVFDMTVDPPLRYKLGSDHASGADE